MARVLAILLLAASAALAWLSIGDRRSPLALDLVEWDGRLGVPVWAVAAGLGVLLLALSFLGRSKPPAPTDSRPRPRPPGRALPPSSEAPPLPAGAGWTSEVVARAHALAWEDGVSLTVHAGPELPFELRIRRATPARLRRSLGSLASFLSAIPTPRRVRVVVEDGLDDERALHKLVEGSLRQHFGVQDLRAVGSRDHVDVLFSRPDPRWGLVSRG